MEKPRTKMRTKPLAGEHTQTRKLMDPVTALNERERAFAHHIVKGMKPLHAARAAGYSDPNRYAYELMKRSGIKDAVTYLHKKHEKVSDMDRKKVMDGFLEAIDMAKMQGESGVMVNGWREIGKMCGYYAPEVKKIDINITAKRVIDKLETLSDNELAEMIEQSSALIEGEATEVLNEAQDMAEAEYEEIRGRFTDA